MTVESWIIPNLIQGISQQSPQDRRDSQCEDQRDCLNSPKDGAVSRHGFDVLRVLDADLTGGYFFEVIRSPQEHYLMCISGGSVLAYNLATGGTDCTVTEAVGYGDYLTNDTMGFTRQTVADFTFVASKDVPPAMDAALSSTRPKECLLSFKAGAYLTKYTIAVVYAGTVYRYSYITPDNSVVGNAPYIHTHYLAATFYRAMSGSTAPLNSYGVGAAFPGDVGSSPPGGPPTVVELPAGSTRLTDIGFGLEINGSLIRLYRLDGNDFDVDVVDGQGGTQLVALKDNIQTFSDLPKGGFEGMTFKVRPTASEAEDTDYFVEYVNKTATAGFWKERVAQGVKYQFDPDTMPHAIVNTALNTFEVRRLTWSNRIAGDGVFTAKDPGFVGKNIRQLFYHKNRLSILTDGAADFSKARNPYTFFPDTAQTVLPDAAIGIELAGAGASAVLSKVSQVDEGLLLWAQGAQFRVSSGNDPFRQDTVEADPSTAYEFSEEVDFARVGSSLYFITEADQFATVRQLQFQNGRPAGDIDVTDHVSDLIPAGCTFMSASDTGKMLTVQTESAPRNLFLYNFLIREKSLVQSAWNVWALPQGKVLWHGIHRMMLYVAMERGGKTLLMACPLRPSSVDAGLTIRLRLDLRVSEADCTITYDAVENESTITLPYSATSPADDDTISPAPEFVLAYRSVTGSASRSPGTLETIKRFEDGGTKVIVGGDLTLAEFFCGFTIASYRDESEFFIRSARGVVPTDELTIDSFRVNHSGTGYYRIEVDQGLGRAKRVETLFTRKLGPGIDLTQPPPLATGYLVVPVEEDSKLARIRIINDSVFPSRWKSAEYRYKKVLRAQPSRDRPQE